MIDNFNENITFDELTNLVQSDKHQFLVLIKTQKQRIFGNRKRYYKQRLWQWIF